MQLKSSSLSGHLAAMFCILVWGTTYTSSKILLTVLTPVELLIMRFVIGYGVLWILYPHRLKVKSRKDELNFILCGVIGICFYYLSENIALTYTLAANVGVIIAAAPFLTVLIAKLFGSKEKQLPRFYLGFVIAMIGICLLSFGSSGVTVHFFGDFLGIVAAVCWASYSILTKRISHQGYPLIACTRRMFFYGILAMSVPAVIFDFSPDLSAMANPVMILNLLFLAVIGCAICYIIWNYAVQTIGAIKTSIYIYLSPVVTVLTSVAILHEKITPASACGIILTLIGLILSEEQIKLPFLSARNAADHSHPTTE